MLKVILDFRVNLRPVWNIRDLISKKKKGKN